VVNVLVEQENPTTGELIGRSARFAPEVDGQVYIQASPESLRASLGGMTLVKITAADPYDLYGYVASAADLLPATATSARS
jgi:ribosomal protein S12 methylthiotransferase